MNRIVSRVFIFLFSTFAFGGYSQQIATGMREGNYGHTARELFMMNTEYRSAQNPEYWKNRKPFEGYWQQDVHYSIKAKIDEQKDQVIAGMQLNYFNNSPDTLRFVYFHLYQNAFQPGSYAEDLYKTNHYPVRFGPYEAEGKGTEILSMKSNGQDLKMEFDNTIVKVWLPQDLLPGSSASFDISFITYFDYRGNIRRRMKEYGSYGFKHFNGVHWYPRICVYDRKFGWTTDQHLGKEFYGDYGTYEVELEFSEDFVVGATGALVNPKDVFPGDLRDRLDISNFKDKPWDEKPSVVTPYNPAKRKTWKFRAINVHDFAWTADPNYRIGEVAVNPSGKGGDEILIQALALEPHASRWQNAAEYAAKVIHVYSTDIGMYAYNKMIVADAADGMEYPMITLDGGSDPGYRGLFAHEIGHNWFFGMVGNNETYRASLDEGFTQFLTVWAQERIDGKYSINGKFASKYAEKYTKPDEIRFSRAYYGYLRDAISEEDPQLNTHSDDFDGALAHGGGYGNVYYKTATMLFNLQYVLGDTLFNQALTHYFNQWKFAHPYFDDFRNSIVSFTHADLNWFFDQWLETSKNIDYKVSGVKRKGDGNYSITFRRLGEMQMPIDFTVFDTNGKAYNYYIPNTWFTKSTSSTVLPRWIGWGKLKQTYVADIKIEGRLQNVVIDTSGRLADINRVNNRLHEKTTVAFDSRIYNRPDPAHYEWFVRPDLWYNFYDGVKFGLHLRGNYMQKKHLVDFTFWLNTGAIKDQQNYDFDYNGFNPVSFTLSYRNPVTKFIKGATVFAETRYLDGLALGKAGIEIENRKGNNTFFAYVKSLIRPDSSDINYLIYRNQWNPVKWNNTLNVGLTHTYDYTRGDGNISVLLRGSAPGSDFDYAQLRLESVNHNYIGKFVFNTRFFIQAGTGSNLAPESALYMASASPEEMMENKFVRSAAFFPLEWGGYGNTTNNFQYGGGLNLRGYAGYLLPYENSDGLIVPLFSSNSGASVNAELEFDRLIRFRPRFTRNWLKLNMYLFGDAGILQANGPGQKVEVGDFRADAGLGTAWTIKKWGPLNMESPLTIRFDMPFFLNRTPDVSPDYVQFRWVLGVERAF
ncbi:MAG: M1 family metallopeptidase [Bacteroidia bacterium]